MAEVVTGEAVVLEVPCARFPSRMLALAIDLAIQLTIILSCSPSWRWVRRITA